jgi:hypothetical protein
MDNEAGNMKFGIDIGLLTFTNYEQYYKQTEHTQNLYLSNNFFYNSIKFFIYLRAELNSQ